MEWFERNVRPAQAAFQERPEIFNSVGMQSAVHVGFSVIDNLMSEVFVQSPISEEIIGVKFGSGLNMLFNSSVQSGNRAIGDHLSFYGATIQESSNDGFIAEGHFIHPRSL